MSMPFSVFAMDSSIWRHDWLPASKPLKSMEWFPDSPRLFQSMGSRPPGFMSVHM